ncbi:hypothetical protein [Streptomyces sp. NPDC057939]|uniref:hypothetical protein n=1 Tax=Streptomyces sp. NPDC057939 TaxID=3346284 RepID=UPI0036E3641A
MSAAGSDLEAQCRLVLTAHPLQRVGAYAIAALAGDDHPEDLQSAGFARAVEQVTQHAVAAALVRDSKGATGFWLKMSYSFFPNSPMNHPGNGKKPDGVVRDAVRGWRGLPDPGLWPDAGCVLCGRRAVGFFGKLDVALAESEAYRNNVPRGHSGMALCQPCRVCFHALPYGCQLTGGSSIALHSWDERFLRRVVTRQVERNLPLAETGDPGRRQTDVREVVALTALRRYSERVSGGVELLVFNNNNRGQLLEQHAVEQVLAEWLRRTSRDAVLRRGFTALLRAHATKTDPGVVALSRNAFREPGRIFGSGVRHVGRLVAGGSADREEVADLVTLLYSLVTEVMLMNEKDLSEIRATAGRIARLFAAEESGGQLRKFRALLKDAPRLRRWLTDQGVRRAIRPPEGGSGPLVTERGFTLLFDPGADNPAWFHRDLLLVGVLEELSRLGWQAVDGADVADDEGVDGVLDAGDSAFISDDEEEYVR